MKTKVVKAIMPLKIFTALLGGFYLFTISSCSNSQSDASFQASYLDTLQGTLNAFKLAINFDPDILSKRVATLTPIADSLSVSNDELSKREALEIKAMIASYESYVETYAWNMGMHFTYQSDLNMLKSKSEKNIISRDEFKEEYKNMKEDLLEMLVLIDKTSRPVIELEATYARLSQRFSSLP